MTGLKPSRIEFSHLFVAALLGLSFTLAASSAWATAAERGSTRFNRPVCRPERPSTFACCVGTTSKISTASGSAIRASRLKRRWKKSRDSSGVVENAFVVTCAPDVPDGVYEMRAIGLWGASNCRRFMVSRREQPDEVEPNQLPPQATPLEIGKDVNSRLDQGNDVDWFTFTATAGQRIVFDCYAERLDSIMDATLEVYNTARIRRLARATDVSGFDPTPRVRRSCRWRVQAACVRCRVS